MATLWIAGEERPTNTSAVITAPWNGSVLGAVGLADGSLAEEAIVRAVECFHRATALPAYVRRGFVACIADKIREKRERFAVTLSRESGKPIVQARAEVDRAIETFSLAAEECSRFFGEALRLDGQLRGDGAVGLAVWAPVGPLLAITPFNFPLNLVAHKLAPAMALGVPVVLKPAPQTPLTAMLLAEVVAEARAVNERVPAGVLSVLPCENNVAEVLVRDPRFGALSFTGSATVGWHLRSIAGRKRVTLELGGTAVLIVAGDAKVDRAVRAALGSSFAYAGQVCIKTQRVYVHERHYESVRDALVNGARETRVTDPEEVTAVCGPMIDERSAKRVRHWLDEGVKAGAKVLCGGELDGNRLTPAVVEGARAGMKIFDEEIFGPVVTVHRFDAIESVVNEVNAGRYGLQGAVFTESVETVKKVFWGLQMGGVIVNDAPTFRVDAMPYGGVKDSGEGKEGVRYAMEGLCEKRLLVLSDFGGEL